MLQVPKSVFPGLLFSIDPELDHIDFEFNLVGEACIFEP